MGTAKKKGELDLEDRHSDILDNHQHISSRNARVKFSKLINIARIDNERVVITDHGEPAAAIISIQDLKQYEELISKLKNKTNARSKKSPPS